MISRFYFIVALGSAVGGWVALQAAAPPVNPFGDKGAGPVPVPFAKAKAMLVSYVPGKIKRVRVACDKAGLKIVTEDLGSHFVVCVWPEGKFGPALDTLNKANAQEKATSGDGKGLILSVEPDLFKPVDLLPPLPPAKKQPAKDKPIEK